MTREEFEELVAEALDRIPPELTRLMDNVAVFVEANRPRTIPSCSGSTRGLR
jgi:predicted Zn-dependent protease with MMP-like domain